MGRTIDTLNPGTSSKRIAGPIMVAIFDNLIYLNKNFELEPMLATEWSASDDGLVYTFKLRDDVTFHDGTPFNAAAVVANFAYITAETTESKSAISALGDCTSAKATGEFEVQIT